jgi:hypothetical protein
MTQELGRTVPLDHATLDDVTLVGIDCVDIERIVAVAEICQRHLRFKEVRLFSHLPHDAVGVTPIERLTSKEAYSAFVIKDLYRYISTSHVLMFQWDGFVLNPSGWRDDFLRYDYIGAPWIDDRKEGQNVGNGGFSLRSRRLLEAIATAPGLNVCHPEDVVICRTFGDYLKARGMTFAPEEVARQFSVEGWTWNGEFGFHRANISAWPIEQFVDVERYPKFVAEFRRWFPVLVPPAPSHTLRA